MTQLPSWIRVRVPGGEESAHVQDLVRAAGLHTVCESARCPNRPECYGRGTATFMILGDRCTRQCRFCAVAGGQPSPVDETEPRRVAEAAAGMKLAHVVVTSVTRDDVDDGGAGMFAAVVHALRERLPRASIEVLVPDFQGREHDIRRVLDAGPDVFNHNLETIQRLQRMARPSADYRRSLGVLRLAARYGRGMKVKSGLMVGLGEQEAELFEALVDLRNAGCAWVTIGQYLAPSRDHIPVARFVPQAEFEHYRVRAMGLGFQGVVAGPLVRSSYRAGELMKEGNHDTGGN